MNDWHYYCAECGLSAAEHEDGERPDPDACEAFQERTVQEIAEDWADIREQERREQF